MTIKIPLNKTKAIRLFIIFVLVVLLSALMVTQPQFFTHNSNSYGFVKTVGITATILFVLAATIVSNKVFKRAPGLQLDDDGIIDNSLGVVFQKVLWADVIEIKTMHAGNENFITLMIKNPESYINKEPNSVKRKMLQLNYQTLRTPINIAASRLKMDFDELLNTFLSYWKEYK